MRSLEQIQRSQKRNSAIAARSDGAEQLHRGIHFFGKDGISFRIDGKAVELFLNGLHDDEGVFPELLHRYVLETVTHGGFFYCHCGLSFMVAFYRPDRNGARRFRVRVESSWHRISLWQDWN